MEKQKYSGLNSYVKILFWSLKPMVVLIVVHLVGLYVNISPANGFKLPLWEGRKSCNDVFLLVSNRGRGRRTVFGSIKDFQNHPLKRFYSKRTILETIFFLVCKRSFI